MFSWLKKDPKIKKGEYEDDKESSNYGNVDHSDDENKAINRITTDFQDAQATRMSETDETGFSIEDNWEDEYYIYKGGGLQWLTNFAYRSKRARQIRPNSEDNFVFNAITIQHANITANVPEITMSGTGEDDEDIARKLTYATKFNDERNDFQKIWKKWVYDFIGAGPTIAMVAWDNEWMGGSGPNRWVGDVRLIRCDKWDMYFDPAITNLDENMQDCSYIIRRPRKKLRGIRSRWPERGKYVGEMTNEDDLTYEGGNPQQAYVIEYWHRGFPFYMPKERVTALREKAAELESDGDYYKAQDYYDAAKGVLEGIHVAYVADNVLLEYCPYEYEDGLYPFAYTTRYFDEKSPWGFGEIRNIKIPQIMHNKADEVEIEAMSKEGLGGGYYNKGAVNTRQMDNIVTNSGKGGMWFEVDNVQLMKDRTGVKVPSSISNYKEHKQRMIETISQVTPLQQGFAPNSNMSFKLGNELGARADIRMKQASQKLEDFLKQMQRLRVNRYAQFYTEDRYYRIKGSDGKIKEGTISSGEMHKEWARDTVQVDQIDPVTQQPYQESVQRMERYVPELDVKVSILSEKPTDRSYYTNLAMQLYQMQLLTPEDLLSTLEEGKMPPMDDILNHVYSQNAVMAMVNQVQQLPQELQQMAMQTIQQVMQEFMGGVNEAMMVQGQQGQGQKQGQAQAQRPAPMRPQMQQQGSMMGGDFDG